MTCAIISGMENIADIRYKNTRLLIEERCDPKKQIKEFAGMISVQPGYASGMASPDPDKRSRPIGNSMARRIEHAFGVEKYWLDNPHWPELKANHNQVSEAKRVYPVATSRTIPVIPADEVGLYLSGEKNADAFTKWKSIDLVVPSPRTFILIEETRALAPMWQPGDVHYIDPDTPAEDGRLAAFLLNGRAVVGLFERGASGNRLTFSNPREPVVNLENATFAGSVTVTLKREFYDQITLA